MYPYICQSVAELMKKMHIHSTTLFIRNSEILSLGVRDVDLEITVLSEINQGGKKSHILHSYVKPTRVDVAEDEHGF